MKIMKIKKLFAIRKEKQNMEENSKKPIAEEKLKQVTGGGAFDDVPTVDEHDYDEKTKIVSTTEKPMEERE